MPLPYYPAYGAASFGGGAARPSFAAVAGGGSGAAGLTSSFSRPLGLQRYHLQIYRGICLRSDVDTEVDNLLGMQSMIATVGSLVAGARASACRHPLRVSCLEQQRAQQTHARSSGGASYSLVRTTAAPAGPVFVVRVQA
jgi:hypothetical protein